MSCTIVAGPPCAGKSTYVDEHAAPGALIVCWDTIARELGSPRDHDHPPRLWRATAEAYRQRLAEVHDADEAWIIRTLIDPTERAAWGMPVRRRAHRPRPTARRAARARPLTAQPGEGGRRDPPPVRRQPQRQHAVVTANLPHRNPLTFTPTKRQN